MLSRNFGQLASIKLQALGFDVKTTKSMCDFIVEKVFEKFKLSFDGTQDFVFQTEFFEEFEGFEFALHFPRYLLFDLSLTLDNC